MNDYIINLKKDLIEQFKNKTNVEALIEVIGRQLNELYLFFEQLKVGRCIHNAKGKQLDGIGDIVALSRNDAAKLINSSELTSQNIDDDTYRRYLFYKILRNTCNSTYYDVMKSINMFWGETPLKYSESNEYPATILFEFDANEQSANDVFCLPYIKAGGVGLFAKMKKDDESHIGLSEISVFKFKFENTIEQIDYSDFPTWFVDDKSQMLVDDDGNILIV